MFPLKKALIIVFLGIFFSVILSNTSVFLAYLVWFGALAYPLYHYFYKKEKIGSSTGEKFGGCFLWLLVGLLGLMGLGLHGNSPQTVDATVTTGTVLTGEVATGEITGSAEIVSEAIVPTETEEQNQAQPSVIPQPSPAQESAIAPVSQATPATPTPTPSIPVQDAPKYPTYTFFSVIDGDTIKVKDASGKKITIRMIGLDAPESTAQRRGYAECYGKEATSHLRTLLRGASALQVETDASQGERDKYQRLLAYVHFQGENINQQMIADGYAFEYTYDGAYKYQSAFRSAQSSAQSAGIGLWAQSSCAGQRTAVANTPAKTPAKATSSAPAQITTPSKPSAPSQASSAQPAPTPVQEVQPARIYHNGKRGGCYYFGPSGKKVYVDHAFCGR